MFLVTSLLFLSPALFRDEVTKEEASHSDYNPEMSYAHTTTNGTEYYGFNKTQMLQNDTDVAEGARSNVVPRHNHNENLTAAVGNAHHFLSSNDHHDICGTYGNSSACCQWDTGSEIYVPEGYAGPGFGNFSCRTFYCHNTTISLKNQPSLPDAHATNTWTVPTDSELINAGFMSAGTWPANAKECEVEAGNYTNGCAGTTCRFIKHMQSDLDTEATWPQKRLGSRNRALCSYDEYHNAAKHQASSGAGGYQCVMAVTTHHEDLGKEHKCGMTRDTITGAFDCQCTCKDAVNHKWAGVNSSNAVSGNFVSSEFNVDGINY